MKSTNLWSINKSGEIIRDDLHSDIKKKYKPDVALDRSFIPYLVLIVCAVVDMVFFISLAQTIFYDQVVIAALQVAGFMLAFDLVPIYAGIQKKRVELKITHQKKILTAAYIVFGLAVLLNIALRLLTIREFSSAEATEIKTLYGEISNNVTEKNISNNDIAGALLGMFIPVVTSVTSYFISSISYNPWKIKERNLEERISVKKDALRRYEALLDEARADENFEKNIKADDDQKFEEMKKYQKAKVLGYCDYVRQRLKEHIGDPTSNNILSEEACLELLARLDKELKALDENGGETPEFPVRVQKKPIEV